MSSHHLGLLLCDVPQGQNSIDVNSQRQTSSSTAKARQELHDWLKAGRMSGVTQNFESNSEFLNITSSNSLDSEFMDGLWEDNFQVTDAITEM